MWKTAVIIAAVLSIPAFAYSDTLRVPSDFATIQDAIDAALGGDTVLVAPGTYLEMIDFKGKAISVRSNDGPEVTVIDAKHKGTVVSFQNSEGPDSILDGFTVKNGNNFTRAGGVLCVSVSPSIINNIIRNSQSAKKGGGIYCEDSEPLIENNIIRNNHAYSFGGVGGGIYSHESRPVIVSNEFIDNTASEFGGAIYCDKNETVIIRGNYIYSNNANHAGAGIDCNYGSPVIEHNYIAHNTTGEGDGGGLLLRNCDSASVVNCHFHSNYGVHNGGGMSCMGAQSVSIVNCTFTWNLVDSGDGLSLHLRQDSSVSVTNSILYSKSYLEPEFEIWIGEAGAPSTLEIEYSDVHGDKENAYVTPGSTLIWGDGMIDADPLFVMHTTIPHDAHLTYPSPCRDAGDNSAVTWLEDLEGDPRIAWGGTVDMGADEFFNHLYVKGNEKPGGDIVGRITGLPSTAPVGLFVGSGTLPSPIPTMWGEFRLQAPWILFTLYPIPANGLLEIPTTLPKSIPAPYDVPMQALIGLNGDSLTNLYVLEVR